jgi:hypothetical protein
MNSRNIEEGTFSTVQSPPVSVAGAKPAHSEVRHDCDGRRDAGGSVARSSQSGRRTKTAAARGYAVIVWSRMRQMRRFARRRATSTSSQSGTAPGAPGAPMTNTEEGKRFVDSGTGAAAWISQPQQQREDPLPTQNAARCTHGGSGRVGRSARARTPAPATVPRRSRDEGPAAPPAARRSETYLQSRGTSFGARAARWPASSRTCGSGSASVSSPSSAWARS